MDRIRADRSARNFVDTEIPQRSHGESARPASSGVAVAASMIMSARPLIRFTFTPPIACAHPDTLSLILCINVDINVCIGQEKVSIIIIRQLHTSIDTACLPVLPRPKRDMQHLAFPTSHHTFYSTRTMGRARVLSTCHTSVIPKYLPVTLRVDFTRIQYDTFGLYVVS